MAKIVHVIPPAGSGGDRHQEEFQDNTSEAEIWMLIGVRARKYGLLKIGEQSMFYLDHPRTVVTYGVIEKGQFKATDEIDKQKIKDTLLEVAGFA